jgi:hypothetical protein
MSNASRKTVRIPVPVVLLLLLWPLSGSTAESCLKRVFDRYCLGGDFNVLVRQSPPMRQQQEGEKQAAVYWEGRGETYVLAFRQRIYKVVREQRPSSQLHFQDLVELLTQKYGKPQDRSRFPHYADSRAARIVAIRRGEGRAEQVWNPGQGWLVELSWTRELGLALSYVAEQLDAERRRAAQQAL